MKTNVRVISFLIMAAICLSLFLSLGFNFGISVAEAATEPKSSDLSASVLKSVAKKSHPYILFESSDIESLRNKITDGYSKKAYDFTQATAKKYLSATISVTSGSAGIIGRQLQSYVAYLSIYGALSGDSSYFKKAISLVNTAVSEGTVSIYDSINGALAVSDFGYAYALAYDLLYTHMTESERSNLKKEMEEIGEYIYTNSSALGTWGSSEERRKAWNWNAVTHGALGLIAVSLGAHSEWLTLSIERMKGYYAYAVDSTGAAMEGLHYIGYALNTLVPLDLVIFDNTGTELLDYYPNMQKLPYWSMTMTAPYGNEQAAIGQGAKLDNLAATYYIINKYLQKTELWGWERTYNLEGINTFTSDYQGNGWNVPAIIIYENKALEKKAPDSNIPLVNTYEKGQVLATDGWGKDSSMVTFTSGYGYSGCWNHPDNNTFTFFAKGESFVIDLGANYKKSSEHNVVQVDGVGMRYEGGSSMVAGKITANKKLGNGALYLKGDNADSYNDSVLTESTRQILYMGGDTPYVIAFDYAKGSSSAHKYTTSFYTDSQSNIDLINQSTAKIVGANNGGVAYAFVYSNEGATLSVAKADKTNAIVTENNAVTHRQIILYIAENPDGSIPEVSFTKDGSGKTKITVKYYRSDVLHTDVYTVSDSGEPSASSSKVSPEKTAYGTIPAKYANKTDYPFVIFKSDKSFVGAYSDWATDAKASALNSSKDRGSIVLMRRDFTYTGSQYNNLSQTQTDVVIDLGGFKFTTTHRSFLTAQKKTNNDTGITVKNGKIAIGAASLIRLDTSPTSGGVAYNGKHGFDFSFENIEIILAENAAATNVLCYNSFAEGDPEQFCNMTFTDCAFDLTKSSGDLTLFDMSDYRCKVEAKINGGEIKTSGRAISLTNATGGHSGSSFTFGKSGEAYTRLTLPKGASLPFHYANGGILTPSLLSEGTNTVTYVLSIASIENFYTPKMSISIESDLIMNVYVPRAWLSEFTLNGAEYTDFSALSENITTHEGIDYYLIPITLAAKEAAREIGLKVTLLIDGTKATGSFSLGIMQYSEEIIDSGSDAEIRLVKDILSYVRAAYAYFGTDDASAIARINSILGEGYDEDNLPSLDYSSSISTAGLKGVTFILGATPTVRFYITGEADDYAFYSDDIRLPATVGSDNWGVYLDMEISASDLSEVITYTRGDSASGSYHVSSYYTFITTDARYKDNGRLTNLVARFIRYCESASEYKHQLS